MSDVAPARPLSSEAFSEWVANKIKAGSAIVPFIGSGVSAESGIVTGRDFDGYLSWVVFRCIHTPEEAAKCPLGDPPPREKLRRLNLRKQGWPPPPTPSELQRARSWVEKRFRKINESYGIKSPRDERESAEISSRQENREETNVEVDPLAQLLRPLTPRILRTDLTERNDLRLRELLREFHKQGILAEFVIRPDCSPMSRLSLETLAVRSLQDWRSALAFLARVQVKDDIVWLAKDPDQALIDSFNVHLSRGRKPNLAHTMLCHLATRARIRTILTTNFDHLIEDAFAQVGERYEVIPISVKGGLPHPDTVHSQNCILKLHGGMLETRADPSLDDPPTIEDKRRFFNYVRGRDPDDDPTCGFLPGLLMVCGYSGQDARCIQMIKYLLDRDKDAQIVWISHSQRGYQDITRMFSDDEYRVAGEKFSPNDAQIIATVNDRLGLLFYELYQRLTLSLPRGGFAYQFSPNAPPSPFPLAKSEIENFPTTTKSEGDICARLREQNVVEGKVVVVDGKTGLTGLLGDAFDELTKAGEQTIWLELEDYADALALAHEIFAIIAIRIGRFQLDHARFVPKLDKVDTTSISKQWSAHIKTLCDCWRIEPKNWFIFLYARNGPGGCASWEGRPWKQSDYHALADLLRAMRHPAGEPAEQGFNILYAPFSADCSERDSQNRTALARKVESLRPINNGLDALTKDEPEFSRPSAKREDFLPDEVCSAECYPGLFLNLPRLTATESPSFKEIIEIIGERWAKGMQNQKRSQEVSDRAQFLYAAAHFRQSRHISALISEAVYRCPMRFNDVGIDNDQWREEDVDVWLDELAGKVEKKGSGPQILLRKPGGHAWMHRDIRFAVAQLVENVGPIKMPGEPENGFDFPIQNRARTHFWIADWYGRAYRATGHALPLLESLHHFFECLKYISQAKAPSLFKESDENKRYRRRQARRAVYEILKTLRLGRRSIHFWYQPSAGDGWFNLTDKSGGFAFVEKVQEILQELYQETGDYRWQAWMVSLKSELQRLPHLNKAHNLDRAFVPLAGFGPSADFSSARLPSENADQRGYPPLLKTELWAAEREQFWKSFEESIYVGLPPSPDDLAKRLRDALSSHEPTKASHDSHDAGETLRKELRGWRDTFRIRDLTPGQIFNAAQTLFEAGYFHARRAKLLDHLAFEPLAETSTCDESGPDAKSYPALALPLDVARTWVRSCALCEYALDLAFDIHPDLLTQDCRLRVKINTVYGMALGRLRRFFEAHRCLNEAHALLSKSEGAMEPLDLGIIELRRAEVHLTEAKLVRRFLVMLDEVGEIQSPENFLEQVRRKLRGAEGYREEDCKNVATQWRDRYFPQTSGFDDAPFQEDPQLQLQREHFAKLDDAALALERAEHALSGKTHSSVWWGRLHTLRLALYATHYRLPKLTDCNFRVLAFRTRQDKLEAIQRTYENGSATSSAGESYFLLRLAEYAFRACEAFREIDMENDFRQKLLREIESNSKDIPVNDGNTLIRGYARRLENQVRRHLESRSKKVVTARSDPSR